MSRITEAFLNFLDRNGRKRIIMDRQDREPYLERYYVLFKERVTFPYNVFLHKFLKSDPDHVHDHPWNYFTIILKGGYWEWLPQFDEQGKLSCEVKVWRGPGSFRFGKMHNYHRIELDPDVTAWTLFFVGPKKREWGFLVKNEWIHYETYLKEQSEQN